MAAHKGGNAGAKDGRTQGGERGGKGWPHTRGGMRGQRMAAHKVRRWDTGQEGLGRKAGWQERGRLALGRAAGSACMCMCVCGGCGGERAYSALARLSRCAWALSGALQGFTLSTAPYVALARLSRCAWALS
eukprot:57957-Chlamydomonas_euryale.AAC.1